MCSDEGRASSQSGLGPLFSDLRVVCRSTCCYPKGCAATCPRSPRLGRFRRAGETPGDGRARDPDSLAVALRQGGGEEAPRVAEFIAGIAGGRALNVIHVEKPHYPWNHFQAAASTRTFPASSRGCFADDPLAGRGRSPTSPCSATCSESGFTDGLLDELIAA